MWNLFFEKRYVLNLKHRINLKSGIQSKDINYCILGFLVALNISRQQINVMVDPIVKYKTYRFCKKYCSDQHLHFQCTLPERAFPAPKSQSLLCEWGNASYCWMLDDLTKKSRLECFKGDTKKQLGNYFFTIANTLPFYERWKNWRFDNRKNVPLYIQALSQDASKIFLSLYNKEKIPFIAQKLNKPEALITEIVNKITITLTQKGKLSLLSKPTEISFSSLLKSNGDDEESTQYDITSTDYEPSTLAFKLELRKIFYELEATEKFVVESMIIDNFSAREVLAALKASNISLKLGLAVNDMNEQHVYHFLRKTLKKLADKIKGS